MNLTKEELLHMLAVIGNCASIGDEGYKLYLRLEEYGNEKYGEDFQEKVKAVEDVLSNAPQFEYHKIEPKIKEITQQ